jgi:hypothetical protein
MKKPLKERAATVLYVSSSRTVEKSLEDFRTLSERVVTSTEALD